MLVGSVANADSSLFFGHRLEQMEEQGYEGVLGE